MSNIELKFLEKVATLTFDRANAAANIFDRVVLEELDSKVREIEKEGDCKGLVITSGKPGIFIAGADLEALTKASEQELEELILLGQSTFTRLSALPFPKVAAIHGACAGGGYELALACDWRVASRDKATRIGLPETQLGILPAWGGTTRLPRLLSLPKALPVIISGKLYKAERAKSLGLVDATVPKEYLLSHALSWLKKGVRAPKKFVSFHNKATVALIKKQTEKSLRERTRGLYPALSEALGVCAKGVLVSTQESLNNERAAILKLAQLPATKKLIGIFFAREAARKLKPCPELEGGKPIKQVAVVGAGVMGAGIAYWLITKGYRVLLLDINNLALSAGVSGVEKALHKAVKRHILTKHEALGARDRLSASSEALPLHRYDLVIEAAVEELEIKKKIFADLSERTSEDALLATNTSALPIHQLAEVISNPERLLGLHFFNPVHSMQLVEVVKAEPTSQEVLARGVAFVQKMGKLPVVVKDSPGFLVNRILVPYMLKAGEMYDQGADPEALDNALLDFGMPMGPLRLMDEVGLDVGLHVANTLVDAFPDRVKVPTSLEKMIKKGFFGRKAGKGFYLYDEKRERSNPKALALRNGEESKLPPDIEPLVKVMSQEAMRCLDEGIVNSASALDFAMVMGTGYAPFRGGPLQYASDSGLTERKFP